MKTPPIKLSKDISSPMFFLSHQHLISLQFPKCNVLFTTDFTLNNARQRPLGSFQILGSLHAGYFSTLDPCSLQEWEPQDPAPVIPRAINTHGGVWQEQTVKNRSKHLQLSTIFGYGLVQKDEQGYSVWHCSPPALGWSPLDVQEDHRDDCGGQEVAQKM